MSEGKGAGITRRGRGEGGGDYGVSIFPWLFSVDMKKITNKERAKKTAGWGLQA